MTTGEAPCYGGLTFPDAVDCPNCGRNVVVQGHVDWPPSGADTTEMHRQHIVGLSSPPFTIRCPYCRHYTTFD